MPEENELQEDTVKLDNDGKPVVAQVKEFLDMSTGKKITVLEPLDSKFPNIMLGKAQIMSGHGPAEFQFNFPTGADAITLEEAFAKFDEFGEKAFNEYQAENSIIRPNNFSGGMPPPQKKDGGIIIP